jgi:hypothetical protein
MVGSGIMEAGSGEDTLVGLDGDDTVHGGRGDDLIATGDGHDSIVWYSGDGNDTVAGGAGQDRLLVNSPGLIPDSVRFAYDDPGMADLVRFPGDGVMTMTGPVSGTMTFMSRGEAVTIRFSGLETVVFRD